MVVYENTSIWIDGKPSFFIRNVDNSLTKFRFDYNEENPMQSTLNDVPVTKAMSIAEFRDATVCIIREFIAVDADYRNEHPKKVDPKDWYLLKIEPSN